MKYVLGIAGSGPGSGKDTLASYVQECAEREGVQTTILGYGDMIRSFIAVGLSTASRKPIEVVEDWMTDRRTKELSRLSQQEWPNMLREITGDPDALVSLWRRVADEFYSVEQVGDALLINPSIRRENEAQVIQEFGGIMVFVHRDAVVETDHECEHQLSAESCDHTVLNNGHLNQLHQEAFNIWNLVKEKQTQPSDKPQLWSSFKDYCEQHGYGAKDEPEWKNT